MKKNFKWCFVGAGVIARKVANDSEGIRIASVCTRHMDSASAFARDFGAKPFDTLIEAVNMADAVYVAVQHPEHMDCTLRALRAGKPVLCEKPMAVNAAQVRAMIEEAKKQDLYLAEAMWTRYNPVIRTVRGWIDSGQIGDIHYITADFSSVNEYAPDKYHFQWARGGGSLLDVGVYPIAFVQMLLGKPKSISVQAKIVDDIDHRVIALFKYDDGKAASVFSAFDSDSRWTATIHGSKGSIVVPEFWQAREASMHLSTGEIVETRREGCVGWGYQMRGVEEEILAGKKQSDVISLQDSLEIAEIMDEIRDLAGVRYSWDD